MCVNGLLVIGCQFNLVKMKLTIFFLLWKKTYQSLNIAHDNNRIKQSYIAEYLGCYLDTNLSGESMAIKFLKKINAKLQFLSKKLSF